MNQLDYFERKLDNKNRLTIPTQLRDELGGTVVITPGFGKYLHMYSSEVWNTEMEPALTGDILDETKADLNVRFRMGKSVHNLDSKQESNFRSSSDGFTWLSRYHRGASW